MDLILCHRTADFDALGAAVGLTRLHPGSRILMAGGCHPTVREFLALHRDEFATIETRCVEPTKIKTIYIVDVQTKSRLGKAAQWLDLPNVTDVIVFDHHLETRQDILATAAYIEPVGATTTLIVERLQQLEANKSKLIRHAQTEDFLTPAEATIMALAIHADTGSLTFDHSTPRDARALAWLMERGASMTAIAGYAKPSLSPPLQKLLKNALDKLERKTVRTYDIVWVLLETEEVVAGLSGATSQLMEIAEADAILLANCEISQPGEETRLTIVGRSAIEKTNLNGIFKPLGGGGHPRAASVTTKTTEPRTLLAEAIARLCQQIPQPPTARELMSSPVRTIPPETSVGEAHRILLRYGHSGLSVVDAAGELVGIISRRDIDIALHHGFSHAPVKGYMTPQLKTIIPETTLPEIEELMVTYDIGRLPVIENGRLAGIVTRTDVLRELHQQQRPTQKHQHHQGLTSTSIRQTLQQRLAPQLWELLANIAELTEERGWQLYLIGGGVRDVLLGQGEETLMLSDIDLVVDGCWESLAEKKEAVSKQLKSLKSSGDQSDPPAVELGKAVQKLYPEARLEVHGRFQTAALLWHNDPVRDSLWIDIATARTEFYPYPAANPVVEASSIRQDLYRRDFTINALAVRLTSPRCGELLDFFGGLSDLSQRQIRVLHANSFIEDPTRIYRAVRFAVRLGFHLEAQTEGYIRYAINSGVYERPSENRRAPALETRLKSELKYILEAGYWQPALEMLGDLGALRCIHPSLELDRQLWLQVRSLDRCLRRFDSLHNLPHWQMRLEVLIAYLAPEFRGVVANYLQLPVDSMERLENLESAKGRVIESLPKGDRPSQLVWLFREWGLEMLILMAVQCPRWVRRQIWQYLTKWADVKAPLNGKDLKGFGYKPGPIYREILDELLAATLDGEISDRSSAESFVLERYPINN
ncbi:MAG: CBS domain-containing protein [Cyanobacteriota bacterium]|nr:CBS domain-containing protein [Cyanobacteriota bacterium]